MPSGRRAVRIKFWPEYTFLATALILLLAGVGVMAYGAYGSYAEAQHARQEVNQSNREVAQDRQYWQQQERKWWQQELPRALSNYGNCKGK